MASSSMVASSSSSNPTKTIALKTADGKFFKVEESVAMEIGAVKSYFEDNTDADDVSAMPLPNVSASDLTKIISFCGKRLEIWADKTKSEKTKGEELKAFGAEFLKDETNDRLKQLIISANFLEVKELLDALMDIVANRIKHKSVEYVRKFFDIENDFTPEEEAAIREENKWAFEGVDED